MPSRRLLTAIAAASFALVGAIPGSVLAADSSSVHGTVTQDGAPVAGIQVQVLVTGDDMVWTATTDATGAWAVNVPVTVGQTLNVSATGPTVQSSPDAKGCVDDVAMTGRAKVTVDALPPAAIAVSLDTKVSSSVCPATATPHVGPTLPPTDAGGAGGSANGWSIALLVVSMAAIAMLAVGPVARRSGR